MKYSKQMNQLYKDVGKQYYKNWETFQMVGLRSMVEELENGDYDKNSYTNEDVEIICKYICQKYFEYASKAREKLEERKKQNMWY